MEYTKCPHEGCVTRVYIKPWREKNHSHWHGSVSESFNCSSSWMYLGRGRILCQTNKWKKKKSQKKNERNHQHQNCPVKKQRERKKVGSNEFLIWRTFQQGLHWWTGCCCVVVLCCAAFNLNQTGPSGRLKGEKVACRLIHCVERGHSCDFVFVRAERSWKQEISNLASLCLLHVCSCVFVAYRLTRLFLIHHDWNVLGVWEEGGCRSPLLTPDLLFQPQVQHKSTRAFLIHTLHFKTAPPVSQCSVLIRREANDELTTAYAHFTWLLFIQRGVTTLHIDEVKVLFCWCTNSEAPGEIGTGWPAGEGGRQQRQSTEFTGFRRQTVKCWDVTHSLRQDLATIST